MKHRVRFDFPLEQLNAIKELTGVNSNPKAVQSALHFFEWFLQERKNGGKLLLVKNGEQKEIEPIS